MIIKTSCANAQRLPREDKIMPDKERVMWMTIRRALLMIASAIATRYDVH